MSINPKNINITSNNARFRFYDIESLGSVFTLCSYQSWENSIEVYYLIDKDSNLGQSLNTNPIDFKKAIRVILENNPAYKLESTGPRVRFYDLATYEANVNLAKTYSATAVPDICNPDSHRELAPMFRITCDTDPDYDPVNEHDYLCGYNSANYDTTMLACYFSEAFAHLSSVVEQEIIRPDGTHVIESTPTQPFTPPTAALMRQHNDALFDAAYKKQMPNYLTRGAIAGRDGWNSIANRIRSNMLRSGRHLDVSNFNEKTKLVGLKRICGLLGLQIMESDKLSGPNPTVDTVEEFYELLAYNVSDVINTSMVFRHRDYSSGFDLKKNLLEEYPECIYEKAADSYEANISQTSVRKKRLTPDTTSAKISSYVLCPYGRLKDIPVVSLNYPHPLIAEEMGIPVRNVLEDAKEIFYNGTTDPAARADFDKVYDYYNSIQGKNYNVSDEYQEDYIGNTELDLAPVPLPQHAVSLPYYYKDGTPSSCYATLSTGGVHGAEINMARYSYNLQKYEALAADFAEVQERYPDPMDLRLAKTVVMSDGRELPYKTFLTAKTTLKHAEYRDITNQKPKLFLKDSRTGSIKVDASRYRITSYDIVSHEDFKSYYPNLLRNLRFFWNEDLNEDRLAKIYNDKERYGALAADKSLSESQRSRYGQLRNGAKLIANSATGAGDAKFTNTIRMNNAIISMRIIGQLLMWSVAQLQTFAGGRVPSTNTDGVFTVLDHETDMRILEERQARIHIDIEPEKVMLISKDANTRIEVAVDPSKPISQWKTINAGGSGVACYRGPSPSNRLSHPAAIDWAMTEYLKHAAEGTRCTMDSPFNEELGLELFQSIRDNFDSVDALRMFQNIIAASIGNITYPFASDLNEPDAPADQISNPRALQHYNRVFLMKPDTKNIVSLRNAGAYAVTAATAARRRRADPPEAPRRIEPVAKAVLEELGFTTRHSDVYQHNMTLLPIDQDICVRKISGHDPKWPSYILNHDLSALSEPTRQRFLDRIDLTLYNKILGETFTKNWRNQLPDEADNQVNDDDDNDSK